MNPHRIGHTSPSLARCGVSFVSILEKKVSTVIKQVKVEISMMVGTRLSLSNNGLYHIQKAWQWRHMGVMVSQLDHLFNNLFKLTTKKTSKLRITCPLWGESMGDHGFPHRGPTMRKAFPRSDVIMGPMGRCRSKKAQTRLIDPHVHCWNIPWISIVHTYVNKCYSSYKIWIQNSKKSLINLRIKTPGKSSCW